MTPREYGFDERLVMSNGHAASTDVRDVLIDCIPGARKVHKSCGDNDRIGVDWWVEMVGGRMLGVDAKVRELDWAANHPDEDDLALETWSVIEQGVVGWTRDESKRCDYVLWLWTDSKRFCLVPFPMLCAAFKARWQDWKKIYKVRQQSTPWNGGAYHSECVFVDRRELWAEIYRQYGGQGMVACAAASDSDADETNF
jgi:hypothetical protein